LEDKTEGIVGVGVGDGDPAGIKGAGVSDIIRFVNRAPTVPVGDGEELFFDAVRDASVVVGKLGVSDRAGGAIGRAGVVAAIFAVGGAGVGFSGLARVATTGSGAAVAGLGPGAVAVDKHGALALALVVSSDEAPVLSRAVHWSAVGHEEEAGVVAAGEVAAAGTELVRL